MLERDWLLFIEPTALGMGDCHASKEAKTPELVYFLSLH